jgi:hypothetical protein
MLSRINNIDVSCPEQWSSEQIETIDLIHRSGMRTEITGQGIGSNAMFIRYWDRDTSIPLWLNEKLDAFIAPNGEVVVLDRELR